MVHRLARRAEDAADIELQRFQGYKPTFSRKPAIVKGTGSADRGKRRMHTNVGSAGHRGRHAATSVD
jgi:hypothetical protein